MAFVFRASKNTQTDQQAQSNPLSIHPTIQQPNISQQCAPFRSTSIRKLAFQPSKEARPGPGDYNLAGEIVKPTITAYTNNNTIIVKVNTSGTPQFKSLTKRFSPQNPQIEEICQSFPVIRKEVVKKTIKLPRAKLQVNRSGPSIPAKVRVLVNPQQHIVKKQTEQPGPGYYNAILQQKNASQGTVWGKDKVNRFINKSAINVGPGQYIIDSDRKEKKKDVSPVFKSGAVRTFFDTILYNSSNSFIAEYRKNNDFKSFSPSPGQYQVKDSSFQLSPPKPKQFQSFGSTVQRFQQGNIKKRNKIPFYLPTGTTIGATNTFNYSKPAFNSISKKNCCLSEQAQKKSTPGPGQYQSNIQHIRTRIGKSIQKFGTTTQRLPPIPKQQIPENTNLPDVEQEALEKQLLKSGFGQLQTESSMFKSKTNRICFFQPNTTTLDLNYDLSYHDVSKKIERKKIYLENLRRIDVYRPPFEINSPRFAHYQEWSAEEVHKQVNKNKEKIKKEISTQKIISAGGIIGKDERFHSERKGHGVPGVGQYENSKDIWKNKSFNKLFS